LQIIRNTNKWVILLLAAGKSSRTNIPKQFVKVEEKPLLLWLIRKLKLLEPIKIYCVVGAYKDKIISMIEKENIEIIINNDFNKGMMSSIKLGIKNIKEEKVFILPVDCPVTNKNIYIELLKYDLAFPVYNKSGGHPVIISKKYFKDIINNAYRLDKWLNNQNDLVKININNVDILLNLNTDEKIERFIKLLSE